PSDALLEKVEVDGQSVVPVQVARGKWWFSLPAAGGERNLRVSWRYEPAAEPVDRPRCGRPRLDGVSEETTLWQVRVPPGFSLANLPREATLLSPQEAADFFANAPRQQADAKPAAGSWPDWSGRPVYLRTSGNLQSLGVTLTSLDTRAQGRAVSASVLLLLVVALAWLAALWPRLATVLRFFWPEQAILLGALLGLLWGWWVVFLALAVVGVWARILWLGRAVLRLVW